MIDPMLTINRQFPRPDAELLSAFEAIPSGALCDAQNRNGALDYRIKPVTSAQRFVGSALTVHAGPRDNLAAYAALQWVKPGDVLVIATDDHSSCAVLGEHFLGMAHNAGVVAVVTDGLVRDLDGLEQVGIPVHASGTSPNSPWKNGPGMVGLSVVVGGISIHSGDIVVGYAEGVVVVPHERAWAVRDRLEAILYQEANLAEAVQQGHKWPQWLPGVLEAQGVNYLD